MKECTKTERKSLAIFVENLYGGGVQKVLQTLLSHLVIQQLVVKTLMVI